MKEILILNDFLLLKHPVHVSNFILMRLFKTCLKKEREKNDLWQNNSIKF